MFNLIDCHCHLENRVLKDNIETVISSCREKGIIKIITSPTKYEEWETSITLSKRFKEIEYTLGIHPWFLKDKDREITKLLDKHYNEGLIGIGEIGLDRQREKVEFDLQMNVFEEQLKFAVNKNLPVVMHCNKAYNELIETLRKTGVPNIGGIIHSFGSSPEIAKKLFDLGISISMGGNLADKSGKNKIQSLKLAYPDHLLLETDSPNMNPVNPREINSPVNLIKNMENAAELLKISLQELAENSTINAAKIFRLKING